MDLLALQTFGSELEKQALEPVTQVGSLRSAPKQLKPAKPPTPPAPKPGQFGIRTSLTKSSAEEREPMDAAKWKQTAKDALPLIVGGGVGYGLGRTAGRSLARQAAEGIARGKPPGWVKHLPAILTAGGAVAGFGMHQLRKKLKERREEASKKAGVAPPVQSRGIPKRKPSDPWRYESRPAGGL